MCLYYIEIWEHAAGSDRCYALKIQVLVKNFRDHFPILSWEGHSLICLYTHLTFITIVCKSTELTVHQHMPRSGSRSSSPVNTTVGRRRKKTACKETVPTRTILVDNDTTGNRAITPCSDNDATSAERKIKTAKERKARNQRRYYQKSVHSFPCLSSISHQYPTHRVSYPVTKRSNRRKHEFGLPSKFHICKSFQ
jgi:hypothetical protein